MKSFLGNFYRHLAIFSGHTALSVNQIGSEAGQKKDNFETLLLRKRFEDSSSTLNFADNEEKVVFR